MAEDINTSGKDTTKVTSDGVRTHFNSQNVVLSSIDDIKKWYAKKEAQLLENTETSRLSTATEKIEIDGLATTEEHTEGLQTNVEDVVDENHNEPIRKLQTQSDDVEQRKSSNSKLSTRINEDNELEDSSTKTIGTNENVHTSQLQTKIDKASKINELSKDVSSAIKVKKGINKTGSAIARAGSRLQTLSTDVNVGKGFADDLKYVSGKTTQKVFGFATKKLRVKLTAKLTKLFAKIMKAVAKTVVKLVKALVSFIAETAPVSLPIIGIFSVIIVIVAFIGGYNPVFGEGSSNDTINSYVSYISNYENEKSVNVNWCIPLAYIYVLDDSVQYDAGEQYLLNKFDEDGLLTSMSSSTDFYNYFNSHSDVVLEFYSKSSISSTDINNDDWYSFVKDIEKEPDDFMSLINERLKDYETTYAGTGNGKFIYPTNSTTITAGYPNYSDGSYHGGVDFAVPTGTNVGASADGIVVVSTDITSHSNCKCKYTSGGYHSYGRYVVIDHGNGVRTYYCHLSERKVNVGDTVKQGQVIGISGSTGNSSGPHCHFEIRVNNTRVNPITYLEGQ